jgi:putative copper resistance protein D
LAWFLLDFGLFATILRAAVLSFETLVLGGMFFVAFVLLPLQRRSVADLQHAVDRCRREMSWAALALVLSQALYAAVNSAILMSTVQLPLSNVMQADFFLASAAAAVAAAVLWLLLRFSKRIPLLATIPLGAILLAGSIWTSHSVSRLDHRALTAVLTGVHQLAAAGWIGAMPFLLLTLSADVHAANGRSVVRRYSVLALVSVVALICAGVGLSFFYVGSWQGLYGTAYGFMIITKIALLLGLLALGSVNWWMIRGLNNPNTVPITVKPILARLRRITEAEVGIGFSILLATASLTSQPPAVDLVADRLSTHEIVQRFTPIIPRFTTPTANQLSPATPLDVALNSFDSSARAQAHNVDPDIAWSEYSHHWAGIILLLIGVGALLSRSTRFPWARYWPLGFAALAVFSFLRGDPENWPLGPISFWKSFYDPEVLQHRVYDLIFVAYAAFELAVQTGRINSRKAAFAFPLMLALGGAGLLLHDHALGNVKTDLLIEMSHNQLAVLAVFGGWARWLEIRLSDPDRLHADHADALAKIAGLVWPCCLILISLVLLNYREA